MAGLAGDGRVRAEKREAILVILDLLRGRFPSVHGVTLRAIGPHLPAVNVGVTIRTILPDVGKNGFQVALRTLHFFVHAAQGIFRFAVIELGNGTDGLPTGGRVTVLAWYVQWTVRTTGSLFLWSNVSGNGWDGSGYGRKRSSNRPHSRNREC